jgi:hypothetical protein
VSWGKVVLAVRSVRAHVGEPRYRGVCLIPHEALGVDATRFSRRASYPQEGRRKTPQRTKPSGSSSRRTHARGPSPPSKRDATSCERWPVRALANPPSGGICSGWASPEKRTVEALERDEWRRAARKVTVSGALNARSLVFVDEMGTNVSLSPLYGWSKRRRRVYGSVPCNRCPATLRQEHHTPFEHDHRPPTGPTPTFSTG